MKTIMNKERLILKQICNRYYIGRNRVNVKIFDGIYWDVETWEQKEFSNYIKNGQLICKWILEKRY